MSKKHYDKTFGTVRLSYVDESKDQRPTINFPDGEMKEIFKLIYSSFSTIFGHFATKNKEGKVLHNELSKEYLLEKVKLMCDTIQTTDEFPQNVKDRYKVLYNLMQVLTKADFNRIYVLTFGQDEPIPDVVMVNLVGGIILSSGYNLKKIGITEKWALEAAKARR
jgi:hypothetical protein